MSVSCFELLSTPNFGCGLVTATGLVSHLNFPMEKSKSFFRMWLVVWYARIWIKDIRISLDSQFHTDVLAPWDFHPSTGPFTSFAFVFE
jgi:multisubunit Na+/H+ antiporter MnhE subunit